MKFLSDIDLNNNRLIKPIITGENHICCGRLSSSNVDPALEANATLLQRINFLPYMGHQIDLWSGTYWERWKFNVTFLDLVSETINKNYDVFAYGKNGSSTISNITNNGSGLIRVSVTGTGLDVFQDQWVKISGVLGTTEANGWWKINYINAGTFDLIGSTFTNTYSTGGVYAYVGLELSAAWNSNTARFASGNYAVTLPSLDGVYTKSGNGGTVDNTRRYLGSIRTSAAGQYEDSVTKRFLYNYYNRRPRRLLKIYSGTWSTTSTTFVNYAGGNTERVEMLVGTADGWLDLYNNMAAFANGSGWWGVTGLDEDGTGNQSAETGVGGYTGGASSFGFWGYAGPARIDKAPAIGYHYYQSICKVGGAGQTVIFYGTNGGSAFGIHGYVWA